METRIIVPVVAVLVAYVAVALADRKDRGLVLVLRFKDQEDAVEGFLRKVAYWALCTGRQVEMVVIVDSSRDRTETIARRLAVELGFHMPPAGDPPVGVGPRTRCLDARPFQGTQLARLPLYALLAA